MSKNATISMAADKDLNRVIEFAKQQLQGQGYEVSAAVMSNNMATLTVQKDRDGIKNIIGLGVESKATITVMGNNTATVNVESEWGNKILACALGWFVCFVPFITGLVGCSSQSGLQNKLIQALQSASATA